ncbi:MAG: anthranilate synthase component I [Burkholderiales bacterium]|nr:anthranilate synthase component I [Burkholderiales bacterium]MDQ3194958.1 anthranilate synthase component I [Pseudomonadota bacterium]
MSEAEFKRLAAQGFNRIPLVRVTFADLDTPLSVYLKLANQPYSYLLESVVGGERFGRYSIVGLPAKVRLSVTAETVRVETGDTMTEQIETADPLGFIETFQARYKAAPVAHDLRFVGGLVGYFGYDCVRYIEARLANITKAAAKADALATPDIVLMLSDELAVVDNLSGKLYLIAYADPAASGAYEAAQQRLDQLTACLREPVRLPAAGPREPLGEAVSEIGKAAFLDAVARSKRYIVDGDIMQVQISQRITVPFAAPPINLYRALRGLNPSPYMYYFDFGKYHVVGASPEILVRQERDKITLRPIAGTRRRGKTPEEDRALEQELLADPKERAEHLMLIDLGRNDVGRVAVTGSVKVTENMTVERYSHVMHIVSNVEGRIKSGITPLGLLRATFPAGTVTGTPKVRAMEIIAELEPSKRGIYAGAVGYLGFNGNMDLAIAIRTAVIKDGVLNAQAAAGIVADSIPEHEWLETQNKARAVLQAAERAAAGLDDA